MGMHAAVVDVARNAGLDVLPDDSIENAVDDIIYAPKEGTMKEDRRLGLYPSRIKSGTLLSEIYGEELIYERHRNRYEVNRMFEERFPGVPKVIVHAPVCRPGWLIEMECMATKAVINETFKPF